MGVIPNETLRHGTMSDGSALLHGAMQIQRRQAYPKNTVRDTAQAGAYWRDGDIDGVWVGDEAGEN